MARRISELIESDDRVFAFAVIGSIVVGLIVVTIFAQAVIIDILSMYHGLRAKTPAYVPTGSSVMWRVSTSAPYMRVTGDLTRIASASSANVSVYGTTNVLCNETTTTFHAQACALSRATLRAGTAKWVADFGFFFSLVIVSVTFQIMHKIDIAVAATGAILCIGFAIAGIAAAGSQVVAVREFARDIEYVAGDAKVSFTAAFGSIFAANCFEFIAVVACIGTYVVYRARCKK